VHVESAEPQNLMPRLPQRLVLGHAVQSVQEAADHCADDSADDAAHAGGYCDLWGRVSAPVGGLPGGRRRRWRRLFGIVSV
jgi:hypothetical protein